MLNLQRNAQNAKTDKIRKTGQHRNHAITLEHFKNYTQFTGKLKESRPVELMPAWSGDGRVGASRKHFQVGAGGRAT